MAGCDDWERHDTFPSVPLGGEVVAVLKNGNKGSIIGLETIGGQPTMLQVQFSENGTVEVGAYEIDHYLTPPKPKRMPDHPGLWKDKDGDWWVYDGCKLRLVKGEGGWHTSGPRGDTMTAKRYAPFTELEVREKA